MLWGMTSSALFDQLLREAAAQPQPQQLLFVFAAAELPPDATPAQRARFEAGQGGALEPLACVDKRLDELSTFAALVEESRAACPPWQAVFIAALSGQGGEWPSPERVDAALGEMVAALRTGRLASYLALDAGGDAISFT